MLVENFKAIFFNSGIYKFSTMDLFLSELDYKAMPQTMECIVA